MLYSCVPKGRIAHRSDKETPKQVNMLSDDSAAQEKLLEDESFEPDVDERHNSSRSPRTIRPFLRRNAVYLLFHAIIMSFYTLVFWAILNRTIRGTDLKVTINKRPYLTYSKNYPLHKDVLLKHQVRLVMPSNMRNSGSTQTQT